MAGPLGGGQAHSGQSHPRVVGSACDPHWRTPPWAPASNILCSYVPHMGEWGAVEGRGPGRDRPRGENREGKEPEAAPHCAFLWGPSCSQTGADPRAGWGCPPVLEGWGCEGLAVRGKRSGTCWGSPGRAPSGQGKAGRGGPQSHLFLLTLAHVGGADGLFTTVHET